MCVPVIRRVRAGLHTTGQEVEMHPFIWEASQIPFRWLLQRHHDDHYNRLTLASLTILDFQVGREQSTGNFRGIFLPQWHKITHICMFLMIFKVYSFSTCEWSFWCSTRLCAALSSFRFRVRKWRQHGGAGSLKLAVGGVSACRGSFTCMLLLLSSIPTHDQTHKNAQTPRSTSACMMRSHL